MAIVSKEHVYDDRISPLLAQILSVCNYHNIAMLASFSIPTEEEPGVDLYFRTHRGVSSPRPHLS